MDMVITRSALFPLPLLPSSSTQLKSRLRYCRCLSEDTSIATTATVTAAGAGELPLALAGRERRRLRQQRREANTDDPLVSNWKEQVEDRLLVLETAKRKSKNKNQKLSISSLSELGPQWWALQVSRTRAPDIAASLANTLSTTFPNLEFKLYNASVRERTTLLDGFIRVKHRPIVPGTIYLHCIMDRHVHHIVETSQGVAGFVGSQVPVRDEGFFTKPKPVSTDDIAAIVIKEKEEQEAADIKFQEKQTGTKRLSRGKKINHAYLLPGVSIRVLSGPFADYTGSLNQLNLKKKKATIDLLLFGKESSVELKLDQIEAVTA